MVYFDQILHTYSSQTGICNGLFDGQWFAKHHFSCLWSGSKMLMTPQPHGIFWSLSSLFTLTLSSHCYAKWWCDFTEHHFGWLMSLSENAHNSWTTPLILIKCCILIHFWKWQGKWQLNKNSHAWICCAFDCWITRKSPRSLCHHLLYILEHFTYISFTCACQIKIVQPLGLHYIARPLGLHHNHYVSLARPLGLYYNIARPLDLHYNHYVSLSVRLWSVRKMLITVYAHYCHLIVF